MKRLTSARRHSTNVEQSIDYAGVAAFGAGAVLLLAAAGFPFTGNLELVGYGVPLGLAGLLAIALGFHRVDGSPDRSA